MFDCVIAGGLVVDGTGTGARVADIAMEDGHIAEIGDRITTPSRQRIDAEGCLVTPGWIDVHTHYDGQATWDDAMEPSAGHGVTSVIMGNCGVGFAPVRPGDEQQLIELMEGVEDIPGTALYEGMPWGSWETYPEYLALLGSRQYALDVASLLPHGALRAYVMGQRGVLNHPATGDDINKMASMLEEGLRAGALGFATSRIIGHRSLGGEPVPGTFASEEELTGICRAMDSVGRGVLQMIPSNAIGNMPGAGPDHQSTEAELALMEHLSTQIGCPVTFTLFQHCDDPESWRKTLAYTDAANKRGARLKPQVSARAPGVVSGLSAYHLFQRRETYLELKKLPWDERLRQLRQPEVKKRILNDRDIPPENAGSMENIYQLLAARAADFFPLGNPLNYEPDPSLRIGDLAARQGRSVEDVIYDLLLEDEGRSFLILFFENYCYKDLSAVRDMLGHSHTISALSDGGAHVNLICDASIPSFSLVHWVRDRSRGEGLPLEFIVAKQTANNADLFGLNDRGRLLEGMRADINIIDFDNLSLGPPRLVADLPGGSTRLLQPASGYRATFVNGVMTRCLDQDTGARPGRLIRGAG